MVTFPDLVFSDLDSVRDLGQFLARARSINDDGVLLQHVGSALATYVPLLTVGELGLSLTSKNDDAATESEPAQDTLLIMGMRVSGLAGTLTGFSTETATGTRAGQPSSGVYAIGDITDRTARAQESPDKTVLIPAPPAQRPAVWASRVPPRSGWEVVADIPSETLEQDASAAITAVAEALPASPGGAVVLTVRERIWASDSTTKEIPLGAAVALKTLGFLSPEEPVRHARAGLWQRLSTSRGHVLVYRR